MKCPAELSTRVARRCSHAKAVKQSGFEPKRFRVVQQSVGSADISAEATNDSMPARAVSDSDTTNSAAVALGRVGTLKGGKARAKALSKAHQPIAKNLHNRHGERNDLGLICY